MKKVILFLKSFIPVTLGLVIHPAVALAIAGLLTIVVFIKPRLILG